MPRIERFRVDQPDIDLRLDTTDRLVDLAREGVALAVRYGGGQYPGLKSTALISEKVFPACGPSLITRVRKLRHADDLRHFRLIHDTTFEAHTSFPTWATWLKNAGARGVDPRRGLRIGSSVMALEAAIDGQGIVLARSVIAANDLAEGRLVQPLNFASPTGYSYYLVQTPESLSAPAKAFATWLLNEAAHFQSLSVRTKTGIRG